MSALSNKIGRPVRTDLKLADQRRPAPGRDVPTSAPRPFSGRPTPDRRALRRPWAGQASRSRGAPATRGSRKSFRAEFPEIASDHNFVAPIWARRKVGYLLDQIRLHGESAEVKKELRETGAHDYSIATPYTSLLVVPSLPRAIPQMSSDNAPMAQADRHPCRSWAAASAAGMGMPAAWECRECAERHGNERRAWAAWAEAWAAWAAAWGAGAACQAAASRNGAGVREPGTGGRVSAPTQSGMQSIRPNRDAGGRSPVSLERKRGDRPGTAGCGIENRHAG